MQYRWSYVKEHFPDIAKQEIEAVLQHMLEDNRMDSEEPDDGGIAYNIHAPLPDAESIEAMLDSIDHSDFEGPYMIEIPDAKVSDVNNDGDVDVAEVDTSGDGEPDVTVVDADSKEEEKEAVKAAEEKLSDSSDDLTSTGKTKDELSDDKQSGPTTSDKREKNVKKDVGCAPDGCDAKKNKNDSTESDCTISDARQKNVINALMDLRF